MLFYVLILILIFELVKRFNNYTECFSSSPTNNRLSNSENDDNNDKFAADNEEILMMTQQGGIRKMEFLYIRTSLNKWIAVSTKKEIDGVLKQVSNYEPIQIKSNNVKALNMLGNNGLLVNDASSLYYYIRFLDDMGYIQEKAAVKQKNAKKAKYDLCIKENIVKGSRQANEFCLQKI